MFFQTIFVAVLSIILGLLVCFLGYRLFIVLLPIWAFFAGFLATAEAVQELFGGGFLATTSSWVVGFVIAILFAAAAYFFYYAAIVILAATVGYGIGVGVMAALGASAGFLQFIVGFVVAAALAVAVVVFNLPRVFIVVLTAFAGASMVLTGVLLAFGQIPLSALGSGLVGSYTHTSWLWGLVYVAIAALGIIAQMMVPEAYMLEPYGKEQASLQAPTMGQPARTAPASAPTTAGPEVPAT